MKEAILIQCHKNPAQINMLLNVLKHPNVDIYVHVDKKSNIEKELETNPNFFILPDKLRVDVEWATFSEVRATLNLMYYASKNGNYQHYWLCSGQDYPIKNISEIVDFLQQNPNENFVDIRPSLNSKFGGMKNSLDKRTDIYFPSYILGKGCIRKILKRLLVEITGGYNRTFSLFKRKAPDDVKFYFGSQWFCFSNEMEVWMEKYLETHPEYMKFFKNVNCPDESFFQTLVMMSPYKNKISDYLHYIDWSQGKNNPKILRIEDINALKKSDKLMARKFDIEVDEKIIKAFSTHRNM